MEHIARDIREGRFPQKSEAQVGEPSAEAIAARDRAIVNLRKELRAAIERCAQVAEQFPNRTSSADRFAIAAAIRKLKE